MRIKARDEQCDRDWLLMAIRKSGRARIQLDAVLDVPGKRNAANKVVGAYRARLGGLASVSFIDACEALKFIKELRQYLAEGSPLAGGGYEASREKLL